MFVELYCQGEFLEWDKCTCSLARCSKFLPQGPCRFVLPPRMMRLRKGPASQCGSDMHLCHSEWSRTSFHIFEVQLHEVCVCVNCSCFCPIFYQVLAFFFNIEMFLISLILQISLCLWQILQSFSLSLLFFFFFCHAAGVFKMLYF